MNQIMTLCDLGVGGQKGLVYAPSGISASLTATQYKDPPKIICKVNDNKYVVNPMPNGTCRTIKNQYYKNSIPNFESTGSFGATGVIDKWQK